MTTWEWLDSQMYPLVSLKIVIPVEALWTLIALEWSIVVRGLSRWVRSIVVHVLKASRMATIEVHHACWEIADQHWRSARIIQVRKNRTVIVTCLMSCRK